MNSGFNLAARGAQERDAINAHKQECLDRYRQAMDLASSIYLQRRDKGNKWRMWAERELAARPELEREARAKLNRMMKGQGGDSSRSD